MQKLLGAVPNASGGGGANLFWGCAPPPPRKSVPALLKYIIRNY